MAIVELQVFLTNFLNFSKTLAFLRERAAIAKDFREVVAACGEGFAFDRSIV
jgi:hypothetical protein